MGKVNIIKMRGGVTVAREAHNLKAVGSIPTPATMYDLLNYDIPLISQRSIKLKNDGGPWHNRACGIVSLAMVMKYYEPSLKTELLIEELIKKGEKDFYIKGIGWKHDGIIELAKEYGFAGKKFDVSDLNNKNAIEKLYLIMNIGPVIASIYKDLKQNNKGHLIVISGFKKNTISFNDPNVEENKKLPKKTSLNEFNQGWKKRFIIIFSKKLSHKL